METEIKTTSNWEKAKPYIPWILLVIVCLLLLNQCNDTSAQLAQAKEIQKKVDSAKKDALGYLHKSDELQSVVDKYTDSISTLKKKQYAQEKENSDLKKQTAVQVAEIKKYSHSDYETFFKKRYGDQGIAATESGLSFSDDACLPIVTDLVTGDSAKKEVVNVESQLQTEKSISAEKDNIISTKELQKISLEQSIKSYQEATAGQDEIISDQRSVIKKQSNEKKILKIGVVGGIVVGAVLGFLVTK